MLLDHLNLIKTDRFERAQHVFPAKPARNRFVATPKFS